MNTYYAGQPVIIVTRENRVDSISDAVVEKIGRKWISVKRGWAEFKFDFDGIESDGPGHRARLWPDRAAYEADHERRRLWAEFQQTVDRQRSVPDHLTSQQITDMMTAIKAN